MQTIKYNLIDELVNSNYQDSIVIIDSISDALKEENLWEYDVVSFQIYNKEIRKIKYLSREEEESLIKRKCQGDNEAFWKLVESNLGYVIYVARKFQNHGLILNDLISEGNIGLIKAITNIQDRNYSVRTYALYYIKAEILNALAKYGTQIKRSTSIFSTINKIRRYTSYIEASRGESPDIEEISENLDLRESIVNDAIENMGAEISIEGLKYLCDETLEDIISTLPCCRAIPDSIDEELYSESLFKDLAMALNELENREADILKMYFGIWCKEAKYKEIAERLGITPARVREIQGKAVRKLKGRRSRNLRKYLG